jgi:glycine/D-amino acid oxidase-like deaminating enzyme
MFSIWERNQFVHYDVVIIGGGIVGLSTAYYIQSRFPNYQVLILERGLLPTGASTKNAGFACMGSPSELLDDLKHMSEEEMIQLFLLRRKGLERLKQMVGSDACGYAERGSYELLCKGDEEVLDKLEDLNRLLRSEIHTTAFTLRDDLILNFGLNTHEIISLIQNNCEGELDTGLMMKNLMKKILSCGIEIKTGCLVESFQEEENHVLLNCHNTHGLPPITFKASTLCICNNAFAKQLLPEYDVQPGRGQVLITHPIPNLSFKGIFHFNKGYYYFREYQQRVLFGGGRNLDFEKEHTTALELNEMIQLDLENKLRELILPGNEFEIDLRWSGIMAFGTTKQPILKQHSPRVYVGVRMGGMGVAIGSEVGFQLSNLLSGS